MTYKGLRGYPERIPTHVYIWFPHFFELHNLLADITTFRPAVTKCIKFVNCHYERDMYERPPLHKDISSKDCSACRDYVDKMVDKAIWWFNVGTDKFIRMTFKNFWNDDVTFECCILWIKRVGILEVEIKVEEASEGEKIRRSFRVVCKNNFKVHYFRNLCDKYLLI